MQPSCETGGLTVPPHPPHTHPETSSPLDTSLPPPGRICAQSCLQGWCSPPLGHMMRQLMLLNQDIR